MPKTLILNNTVELYRLHASDIVSIEASGNYSILHVMGDENRTVLFQLGQLVQMLNEQLGNEASVFVRIGRGLIVNRRYIYNIHLTRQTIVMRDALGHRYDEIQASREALKKVKDLVAEESGKEDQL